MKKIPANLVSSKFRKEMWDYAQKCLKKIEKSLPISSAYLLGSFTTKKRRPADVDFIILLKVKNNDQKAKWSLDLVVAPDNEYGNFVLDDAKQWMKSKYGAKGSSVIKMK